MKEEIDQCVGELANNVLEELESKVRHHFVDQAKHMQQEHNERLHRMEDEINKTW